MSDRLSKMMNKQVNEQVTTIVAREAYMLGLLNMVLKDGLEGNLSDLRVNPTRGWLEFQIRGGRVYRLSIEERRESSDEGGQFPVESEEE